VLASKHWNDAGADGSVHQFVVQLEAVAATLIYSAAMTFILVKALSLVTALRPTDREEGMGLDFSQHGEEAYSRGEGAILLLDRRSES
jgi:Amt family ammonium transporter